ncbi:MAG: ion channel [Candidatus Cloacimonadales bacterium]
MHKHNSFLKFIHSNKRVFDFLKIALLIVLFILIGATAITIFEPSSINQDVNIKSVFDGIWWTIVTITTVGYGDYYPVTFAGRIIGIVIIISGFIIFSTFTAYIASSFIDQKIKERKGLNKIKLKNHIVLCGWNHSANRILKFLVEHNYANPVTVVLINELEENTISTIMNNYEQIDIKFICGDFTNQDILNRANIKEATQIIILFDESCKDATPSDERTIIAAHNISFLKVQGKINLQLRHEKYIPSVQRNKIQNIVIYEDIGGDILASSTLNPTIPNFIQNLVRSNEGSGLKEYKIPSEFIHSTFIKLFDYLKKEKGLVLIGVVTVPPEFSIEDILSDDSSNIDQFIKQQFQQSTKKINFLNQNDNVKIKPKDDYIIDENDIAIVI